MVYKRSENEIKMISRSCQIVADTIDMLSECVVPGALISDLDKKAENFITSRGARPAFKGYICLLYTSPSPRDAHESRMPSSA